MAAAGAATQAGPMVRLGQPAGRWVITATVLGSSMAMLDSTVVNVALPTIGRQLHTSLGGLQWVVSAYTLTLAGLILLGGSLGDRLGRRRIFLTGVVWFALASALCGLSPDIDVLIGARALQGIGGALLTPGSLAIIQASFAHDDRPRAVGAWSGLGGVAGAAGPLLGGWIVAGVGWRWVFLINLPVGLLAVVGCYALLRDPAYLTPQRLELRKKPFHFDSLGLSLLIIVMISWEVMLSKGQQWDWPGDPFWRGQTLAIFFAVSWTALVFWELRHRDPGERKDPWGARLPRSGGVYESYPPQQGDMKDHPMFSYAPRFPGSGRRRAC